jgi:hypothetical protein
MGYAIVETSATGSYVHSRIYEDIDDANAARDNWDRSVKAEPTDFIVSELRPVTHTGERLVVVVNSNVTMSRGKTCAQAIHAALMLLGVHHGGPVIVLGGKPADINAMATRVFDAGRTEVAAGALTAGAEWRAQR